MRPVGNESKKIHEWKKEIAVQWRDIEGKEAKFTTQGLCENFIIMIIKKMEVK